MQRSDFPETCDNCIWSIDFIDPRSDYPLSKDFLELKL